MMISEFIERTGFEPTASEYAAKRNCARQEPQRS